MSNSVPAGSVTASPLGMRTAAQSRGSVVMLACCMLKAYRARGEKQRIATFAPMNSQTGQGRPARNGKFGTSLKQTNAAGVHRLETLNSPREQTQYAIE